MGYVVYRVLPKDSRQLERVLKDDIVSRQSIATREARSLGAPGEGTIVLIEGHDKALRRAEELLKGVGESSRARKPRRFTSFFAGRQTTSPPASVLSSAPRVWPPWDAAAGGLGLDGTRFIKRRDP